MPASPRPHLPDRLEVTPRGPIEDSVRVPGSKSITNRALIVAGLAGGESELRGGLASIDTAVMRAALAGFARFQCITRCS